MTRNSKAERIKGELRDDGIYEGAQVLYNGKPHTIERVHVKHHGRSGHSSSHVRLSGVKFSIRADEVDSDTEPDGNFDDFDKLY